MVKESICAYDGSMTYPIAAQTKEENHMRTGAQLYTVRNYTQNEKDFKDTIQRIAKMGYTTVQLSAIGRDLRPEWLRSVCDEAGLSIVLTHSDSNRILYDTEALIEEHKALGCQYIGLGSMPEKYRSPEWLYHFARDYMEPARKIAHAGMLLMYHNHNFEFQKFTAQEAPDQTPKRVMEHLAEWFDENELGFTLDTYWVQAAGADVCQWIRLLKNRIPCVHLKDMEMTGNGAVMAPVMEGNLNFPGILKELEDSVCQYLLVEQDICQTSPFDCLQRSYDNLARAGYR